MQRGTLHEPIWYFCSCDFQYLTPGSSELPYDLKVYITTYGLRYFLEETMHSITLLTRY
jgi:hypothetical protein